MKRTLLDRMGDFVLGRGFYIVLFLCVATIGITGYFLTANNPDPELAQGASPVTGQPEITIPGSQKEAALPLPPATRPQAPTQQTGESGRPVPSAGPEEKPATATEETPAQQAPVPKAPAVFTWPLKGALLMAHSLEVLAYDPTMGDWRVHSGVDLAAGIGTQVLAVSDGTVQAVFDDDLMGRTVVLDHGDGLQSVYSNLSPETTVSSGDTVTTGAILGVVGTTAIGESAMEPHLHLEMTLNGEPVNPVEYFPAR